MVKHEAKTLDQHFFYRELSEVLFKDVRDLYIQVEAQFTNRHPEDSVGAQIASFCVYSCGLFSVYLVKHPWGKLHVLRTLHGQHTNESQNSMSR